jgi:hypothetical protein
MQQEHSKVQKLLSILLLLGKRVLCYKQHIMTLYDTICKVPYDLRPERVTYLVFHIISGYIELVPW